MATKQSTTRTRRARARFQIGERVLIDTPSLRFEGVIKSRSWQDASKSLSGDPMPGGWGYKVSGDPYGEEGGEWCETALASLSTRSNLHFLPVTFDDVSAADPRGGVISNEKATEGARIKQLATQWLHDNYRETYKSVLSGLLASGMTGDEVIERAHELTIGALRQYRKARVQFEGGVS